MIFLICGNILSGFFGTRGGIFPLPLVYEVTSVCVCVYVCICIFVCGPYSVVKNPIFSSSEESNKYVSVLGVSRLKGE